MKSLTSIISIIFLVPTVYSAPLVATTTESVVISAPKAQNEPLIASSSIDSTLFAIAGCESGHLQFQANGTVLRGQINDHDVGEFQISETWNGAEAKALGYDIYTQAGNEGYAVWLYDHRGTKPWLASSKCWEK